MKIRKFISCLLLAALVCCTILTGCSGKDSMFSDMKEISQITSAEFTGEGDVSIKSEDDEDITFHFSMDGKTNGKDCAVNMSFSSGALTITLDDFIRMTNNTIYINQSSLFSTLFGAGDIDGMKKWISAPVSTADDETQAISKSFSNALIDSLENICKDQDISKNDDTWILNIPGEKMASFAAAALDEIDANISSWYDLYVDLLEASGSAELMQEYSALSGEDTIEDEDLVQSLKDNKEDNLNTWKEMSASLRDSLKDLDEAISNKETSASAEMSVSLTGKKGSRTAEETFSFLAENTGDAESMSLFISQQLTETDDISVEAPDETDVMTMEEYSQAMSDYFSAYEDYDEEYTSGLEEEEEAAILSSLKEDDIYLFNSDSSELVPYVITIDPKIYTIDEQIADYGLYLEIPGSDTSYAVITYEAGNLKDDLEDYYLPEGTSLSTLSTDMGNVLWYTETPEDDEYSYTYFGIQLDKNSYLLGMTSIEADDKVDVESWVNGMFKNVRPYEADSDTL
ncbi:MAG: hypothetical protein SO101_11540 [Lachnospiraceae bacterium]|nr:hypothetical protein [Lachnospiraceae bacterium]